MNILMLTNTFPPFVGGVARSVQGFTDEFRRNGHRVVVAAPTFDGTPKGESDVVRYPAIQSFNGSGFSMPVPIPRRLASTLKDFKPDIVHSHHPFLLGATAMRIAAAHNVPLVFTHHTMYEKYTHYVPGDSPRLKRFVTDLVTGYCNLCNAVIAPSEAVAKLLRDRKVVANISVIPTGVNTKFFITGDGAAVRKKLGIPMNAFVIGHVGRLAPEKNLEFLTEGVIRFLKQHSNAHFLLVGSGPAKKQIRAAFLSESLADRLHPVGPLENGELAGAYKAMDVFAFASHTETQGMVLAEAMAAGVPVVAVEASGVREVVRDCVNGRLLEHDSIQEFTNALEWACKFDRNTKLKVAQSARRTAVELDISHTAANALGLYSSLIERTLPERLRVNGNPWAATHRRIRGEWRIMSNLVYAAGDSVRPGLVRETGNSGAAAHRGSESRKRTYPRPMPSPPLRHRTLSRRWRARTLGWLWTCLLRIQYATWRKRCHGIDHLDQILSENRKVMFSFWHGKYVPFFAFLRGRPACIFTSESARGDVIADICRRFGYDCIQIPDDGRIHSLDLMRQALAEHCNGGIAVDGPLGPYHRVKKGAIKLASELGYEVVPASVYAKRKRVLKHRWDRMELPALFTRVGFAIGEPISIPPDLCPEALRHLTESLHQALDRLDRRAAELTGAAEGA